MPSNIIGDAPEVLCTVNGIDTLALIDTGSQITSCSSAHFDKHFSDCQLIDISQILRIESVSGQQLPYQGYFECKLKVSTSIFVKIRSI